MADHCQDHLEVRALLDRYGGAIYRRDWDSAGDCWDEAGIWHAFGERIEGRGFIVDAIRGVSAPYSLIWHTVEAAVVELIADILHCLSFVREVNVSPDRGGVLALGMYNDRVALRHDSYRLVQRH